MIVTDDFCLFVVLWQSKSLPCEKCRRKLLKKSRIYNDVKKSRMQNTGKILNYTY